MRVNLLNALNTLALALDADESMRSGRVMEVRQTKLQPRPMPESIPGDLLLTLALCQVF